MSEDPAHIRAVSLHLSRTLEEVGLNELTVNRRRQTYLYNERINNIGFQLGGIDVNLYHFGSQTEGATTPGLHSDIDSLHFNNKRRVIQYWEEWMPGKTPLLMLQDDTAPGYCRLQLLYSDIPLGVRDLKNAYHVYDSSGRVILKNTMFHVPGVHRVRNGPAGSEYYGPGFIEKDFVQAFKCSSWPSQAEEFIRRHRCHGWPSQELLQESVQHGVFLVPVGYKPSPTEELEWRLSASFTERCLMFSLSLVHIKCYVVLKMLMKTFVEPHVRKCISSYHCKTALLYCTENTDPGFWRDDNLLQCITQCLTLLLNWVTYGFCPHFVISEENLFAGKVTAQNRGNLMSVLTKVIRSNGSVLFQVHHDDLGHRLQAKLNTIPCVMPVLESLETVKLAGDFEYRKQKNIKEVMRFFVAISCNTKKSIPLIRNLFHGIKLLINIIEPSDRLEQQAIKIWTRFLSGWLGSLLASVALSKNMRVPRQALRLLCVWAKYDCAAMLKLVSVFYCIGDVQRAKIILQQIEEHVCINETLVVCWCKVKPVKLSLEFCHMMHLPRGESTHDKLFTNCVTFSSQEIHCIPPALRNELFRSVGDDIRYREPVLEFWMDLAAIDCIPFLYYLQYMTYRQLGPRYLQARALHNLGHSIRNDNDFGHPETAWNVLGQCMELEQQSNAAMACYRTSLEIRPRNNAANWHVAILCFKLVKQLAH